MRYLLRPFNPVGILSQVRWSVTDAFKSWSASISYLSRAVNKRKIFSDPSGIDMMRYLWTGDDLMPPTCWEATGVGCFSHPCCARVYPSVNSLQR